MQRCAESCPRSEWRIGSTISPCVLRITSSSPSIGIECRTLLDTTYGHEGLFTDIQIQDTVEKLIEQQEIRFEVDTFVSEEEGGTALERRDAATARVRDMITSAFFDSSLDPLHEPPDGWDKAARYYQVLLTAARVVGIRRVLLSKDPLQADGFETPRRRFLGTDDHQALDLPAGHLSGMFRLFRDGLDPDRLIIFVDTDDPWFKRRKVRVISRADFDQRPRAVDHRHADLWKRDEDGASRQNEDRGRGRMAVRLSGGAMLEPVMVRFDVALKPSNAGERPHTLISESSEVRGEAKEVDPRELFSSRKSRFSRRRTSRGTGIRGWTCNCATTIHRTPSARTMSFD